MSAAPVEAIRTSRRDEFFVIVRRRWRRRLSLVVGGAALFLVVELAFLASNVTKIPHGAWLPLLIGCVLFTAMVTWFRGQELRRRLEGRLQASSPTSGRTTRPWRGCRAPASS